MALPPATVGATGAHGPAGPRTPGRPAVGRENSRSDGCPVDVPFVRPALKGVVPGNSAVIDRYMTDTRTRRGYSPIRLSAVQSRWSLNLTYLRITPEQIEGAGREPRSSARYLSVCGLFRGTHNAIDPAPDEKATRRDSEWIQRRRPRPTHTLRVE